MLPKDVKNIILNYAYGMEHVERFRPVIQELYMYGLIHRPHWLRSISYFLCYD